MAIVGEKGAMRHWSRSQRQCGSRIALVPTMGFLHEGHLSLVSEAKQRAEKVVVSIYVNPGQFAPGEDLDVYPRDFDGDVEKLKPLGVDIIFNPRDLYVRDSPEKNGAGHETWIRVENLEKPLCGGSRPLFFRGVATVVSKLLNIVEPDVVVFGKKDYQQWRVLSRMVRDLDFGVEVVGCKLVREADGLAMSSRNVRLTATERKNALAIFHSLKRAEELVRSGETDYSVLIEQAVSAISHAGGRVDYASIVDQETLQSVDKVASPSVFAIAAWFGSVRLLDNVELPNS
ncbi:hypothetical protein SELMODRAFT_268726 [Selaginella moellendorffii]|uniref:Pantoate--beta-alanine ligase n=1 Tax=Selaginella moellendorffii TaxID=88036 RepID=D8SJA9_SELML|nr:pantoate--beta-alanine ligase [Selaginella moellendorffii]EFJ15420.1 hypothetical protein SELMODRAFT_268726 [Selaginella moellendorffii]|eukprot:XP_002983519.1 pantoate--beta-alanine ligase [Selaginella moellendorffii]